jgi:hypothetical protein
MFSRAAPARGERRPDERLLVAEPDHVARTFRLHVEAGLNQPDKSFRVVNPEYTRDPVSYTHLTLPTKLL